MTENEYKLYIIMQANIHPDQISGVDYALLLGAGVNMRWESFDKLSIRIPTDDLETAALVIGVMQAYGFKVIDLAKGFR